jgi:Ca-activated chloride channel family protein
MKVTTGIVVNQQKTLHQRWWRILHWIPAASLVIGIAWMTLDSRPFSDWFLTLDQQGSRLFRAEKYEQAASRYSNPLWVGVSHFRSGEFDKAASSFARSSTATAHYNRGNALIMLGKYEEAIKAFDLALEMNPGWDQAATNREIAALRAERLVTEGGEMTGGQMAADEITFDLDPSRGGENQTMDESGQTPVSDQEIQALWLRRVQTRPADFLRSRFAYQLATREDSE